MAAIGNNSPCDQVGESVDLAGSLRGGAGDAVVGSVERDARSLNLGPLGELLLHGFETFFTRRVSDAMAIGVDDHIDEVGIVERRRRAIVDFVGEMPTRRPELPQQLAQTLAIGLQRSPAGFGVEKPRYQRLCAAAGAVARCGAVTFWME